MKIFEFFFFPVSGSESYKDALGFHNNFFITHNGFLWGLILALIIAVVAAGIFYFVMDKNYTLAKPLNWWIISIVVAVIGYFGADIFLIGGQGSNSPSTFYGTNSEWVKEHRKKPNAKEYPKFKIKIENELRKQKDVRIPFDLTCAGWAWLLFLGTSLCFKRYSVNSTQIPF
ncbi:MAG: hypothetical protein K2J82_06290 [Muribaculaceae bacterium]|nr:hypothetical protein [Muribaculaceae bacterium]